MFILSSQRNVELNLKFIMLLNVKMPTFIGILTFISMITTTYESLKGRKYIKHGAFTHLSNHIPHRLAKALLGFGHSAI